jgi:carboxyl-terminal processing protease
METVKRIGFFLIGVFASAALIAVGFIAGLYTHNMTGRVIASGQGTPPYSLLAQTQGYLDQYFFKAQPSATVREYGAIKGLLATLEDRYTFFIDPPVAANESNVLAGVYGGIGVQLQANATGQYVLIPFRDNPAYQAGIREGDILLSVNGKPITIAEKPDAVDQLLRGEVKDGNGVTLTVQHPDGKQSTYKLVFAVIEVPSTMWRVLTEDAQVGYIQIQRFTNRTPDEVKTALAELSAKNVKFLILDVRNNPGGLVDECVKVAGHFLNGGLVFVDKAKNAEKLYNAPENSQLTKLPMVVLVNKNTASGAELLAGALRDRGRAVLIGQQTYGKGSVQFILPLADKSSIHVTTSLWLPPSRTQLEGKGLTPDVPMIPDPNGADVELGEAIRVVKTRQPVP